MVKRTEIDLETLANLLEGIYFSADRDLSDTEELLEYLHKHGDKTIVLTEAQNN